MEYRKEDNNINCLIYKKITSLVPVPIYKKMRLEEKGLSIVASEEYKIHYLNETATTFLSLVDGIKRLDEVVAIFFKEFGIKKEEEIKMLIKDIIELIRDLQWKRIIILREYKN